MGILFKISFRNLLRQKRRNFFLGMAIAVGMMILVATSSFTKGLTDMILNKMLVYSYGHVSINGYENGNRQNPVIRDKDRIIKLIKSVKGVKEVNNYPADYTRVVGNGRSDMMALVGMPPNEGIDFMKTTLKAGNPNDFTNSSIENPVFMSDKRAAYLNVKIGDTLNVRLSTINGQVQSARLTVVATQKELNSGQGMAFYIPLEKMKALRGYRPFESGPLQVVLDRMDDPSSALAAANKIYALLKPDIASFYGEFDAGNMKTHATVLSFYTNSNTMSLIASNLAVVQGSWKAATNSNAIALSAAVSSKLNTRIGDMVTGIYSNKFEGALTTNLYRVAAVYKPGNILGGDTILVSENNFYYGYLRNLPADIDLYKGSYKTATNNVLLPALATEWKLLPRTATSDALQKKIRNALKQDWEGSYYDVSTMYEAASFLLDMQRGLDMISLVAVMILFFVILIGVLNTLRMTIRERTREIGTVRSIGMQKEDVRSTFILETFYLTLFGCIAGIILGVALLNLLSLFTIETDSMFGMLLINKHINFVVSAGNPGIILMLLVLLGLEIAVISLDNHIYRWLVSTLLIIFVLIGFMISGSGSGVLTFLILILNMLMAIAYFPARRAAAMEAAAALRQYE